MGIVSYCRRSIADYVRGRAIRHFHQEYARLCDEFDEAPRLHVGTIPPLTSKDRTLDMPLYVAAPAVTQLGTLGAFIGSWIGLYDLSSDAMAPSYGLLFGAEAIRMYGAYTASADMRQLQRWHTRKIKVLDFDYQTVLFHNRIVHLLDAEKGISHSSGRHRVRTPGMPPLQRVTDDTAEESNWEEEGEDWKKNGEYDPHSN